MRLQEAPCGGRADGDVRSAEAGHGPERLGGVARSLNGIGTCLVVASLGLSVLWGFTSWSRLGIYVGAAFLVVGLTIVADEHFRKDQDTPGFREDQDPPG